jgi:hypothetical protein
MELAQHREPDADDHAHDKEHAHHQLQWAEQCLQDVKRPAVAAGRSGDIRWHDRAANVRPGPNDDGDERHNDDSGQGQPEERRAHDAGVAAERANLADLRLNLVFAREC